MPRFIAVHTLPHSEQELLGMLKEMAPQIPPGFTWKQTYCDFDSKKHFCEWEAPSKEALEQAFKANNLPYDAIHQVRLFNVASMEMEP